MEILWLSFCRTNPFIHQQVDGVDVGDCQLKALDVCLVVPELIRQGSWNHPPHGLGAGPTIHVQVSGVRYSRASNRQGQLSTAFYFNTWFTWTPVLTWQLTSTQTPAAVRLQSQTGSSTADWYWMSPWPQVTGQTLNSYKAFNGNRSHGPQHRP